MLTKFDTTPAAGKGSNTILWVIGLAVVGFIAYQYVIKPRMNKDKETAKQAA